MACGCWWAWCFCAPPVQKQSPGRGRGRGPTAGSTGSSAQHRLHRAGCGRHHCICLTFRYKKTTTVMKTFDAQSLLRGNNLFWDLGFGNHFSKSETMGTEFCSDCHHKAFIMDTTRCLKNVRFLKLFSPLCLWQQSTDMNGTTGKQTSRERMRHPKSPPHHPPPKKREKREILSSCTYR